MDMAYKSDEWDRLMAQVCQYCHEEITRRVYTRWRGGQQTVACCRQHLEQASKGEVMIDPIQVPLFEREVKEILDKMEDVP